jgi:hypothetical protein
VTVSEHATEFAGKKVVEWEPDTPFNPANQVPRISVSWDAADEGKRWLDIFTSFLETPHAAKTTALLIGDWGQTASGSEAGPVVEALVSYRDRLPAIEAIFLGDIIAEESEISWINQTDVGPLFHAFPKLREFVVRGGTGLGFGTIHHPALEKLVIQTGGLDASVVRQILGSRLPQLTHLEIWLGSDNYGANTTVEDLAPLLAGKLFPRLNYLGLRNSEITDAIATAFANAPILHQIETLDLSMGTLGDDGAMALAGSDKTPKLKLLDISHHYVSDKVLKTLKAHVKSLEASDPQEPDKWGGEEHRYVSVSE